MSEQDLIKEFLICGLDDWLYLAKVDAIATKYFLELPNDAVSGSRLRIWWTRGIQRFGMSILRLRHSNIPLRRDSIILSGLCLTPGFC
jgi:hypothetical protein